MMSDFSGIARQFSDRPERDDAGLRVVHTRCTAGSEIPLHRHEHPFLSFLLDGSYSEGHGKQWGRCTANTLTWHPQGDRHQVVHHDRMVSSVQLEFTGKSFEDQVLGKCLPVRRTAGQVPAARPLVNELLREIEFGDEFSVWSIRGCVQQVLALTCRAFHRERTPPPARLVARIEAALNDSFPDSLEMDSVAASLGLTVTRMAALYRRYAGESIGVTARRLRVRRACDLLADPDRPLSGVALECGFCDQSHFNRVFARFMRCTPGSYRKRLGRCSRRRTRAGGED